MVVEEAQEISGREAIDGAGGHGPDGCSQGHDEVTAQLIAVAAQAQVVEQGQVVEGRVFGVAGGVAVEASQVPEETQAGGSQHGAGTGQPTGQAAAAVLYGASATAH